jgi:TfoX/Sxy family transcriptional regulator of competence genes
MPYDPSYLDFVLEQLSSALPALNSRPMFGGVGIYSRGIFFALIADDVLYFFTDETNRTDFEAREMGRFSSRYFEVPVAILEDTDELREWARKAYQAAASRPDRKKPRHRSLIDPK